MLIFNNQRLPIAMPLSYGAPLSVKLAQFQLMAAVSAADLRVSAIIAAVAKVWGCSERELRSPRMQATVASARLAIYWIAREHTELSLPQIGRLLGRRDHTTVLKGARRAAQRMATDAEYLSKVKQALALLRVGEGA